MAEYGFAITWPGPVSRSTRQAMDAELLRNFERTKIEHPELEGHEPELKSYASVGEGFARCWFVDTGAD